MNVSLVSDKMTDDMMNTKSLKPCNVTWIIGAQYMIYISHIQAGYFSREITQKRGNRETV